MAITGIDGYPGSISDCNVSSIWLTVGVDSSIESNKCYFVDTSNGVVNLTLPADPYVGNIITINDLSATFTTYNCVLVGNGQKISGLAENLLLENNNMTISIVYSGTEFGWKITHATI